MAELERHIEVEGGYNIRDLGGYATEDGHVTRWHRVIRAGTLDKLTTLGQQQLADYGVKTIIDLRDEDEAQHFPDLFVPSTTYLNLPFFGDTLSSEKSWQNIWGSTLILHELYHHYFDRCQPQVRAIISAVAENQPGILFHCYAGKDRTGLIAALLLRAVGVPAEVIAQDYEQTHQYIGHLIIQWREAAEKNSDDMRIVERDSGSSTATMFAALDYVQQRYGGVVNYLRQCGITEAQLTRLQTLLVE